MFVILDTRSPILLRFTFRIVNRFCDVLYSEQSKKTVEHEQFTVNEEEKKRTQQKKNLKKRFIFCPEKVG